MSREFVVGGLFGPIDLSQTGERQITLSGVDDDENIPPVIPPAPVISGSGDWIIHWLNYARRKAAERKKRKEEEEEQESIEVVPAQMVNLSFRPIAPITAFVPPSMVKFRGTTRLRDAADLAEFRDFMDFLDAMEEA